MKILLAVLFSAALIWLHPGNTPLQLNNSTKSAHAQTVQVKPVETRLQANNAVAEEKASTEPPTVATTAATVSKVEMGQTGCNTYRSEFAKYQWNVNMAIAICTAESGGRTTAVSATHDYGLMQINHIHADMVHGDLTALFNPSENIAVAWKIYSAHGWTAWDTYKNGSYKRFI